MKDKLKALPAKPGVYLFKGRSGEILYVGKAKSLRKRVSSYFTKAHDIKTTVLLDRLSDIDYMVAGSELDALILEDELIKKYKPRYNIALRDDKAYPYLKLTINEKWPRLFIVRRKQKDGALYFGRFQGGMVREIIRLVKKLFPIRWCKETPLRQREQPCLFYRIGSCSGPCIGKIGHEDYLALVQAIVPLLQGTMDKALDNLRQEMDKASAQQDYERAAYLRDRINLLEKMVENQGLSRAPVPRKIEEVAELRRVLGLKTDPMRIEGFDISNTQGRQVVASMVTFFGGLPLKADYRRFRIRSTGDRPNDVLAMSEVVLRRYSGQLARKLPLPDLILIDGGIAQVNTAALALTQTGHKDIPVIGLAKKNEEIYLPKAKKPLILDKRTPALKLLQRVRDEAHRFAVEYHRHKRSKSLFGK
ncbi:MAG: excinuclease ABC subunit UvrC [Candidatus Saganbacteria bacterium]|nr:excinuclease ABC subunit UvrC [Candidatus Saganbacteria bacterium]